MRRMKTTTNTKSCKATRSFASLVSFPKQTHKQTDDSPFIIYTIHTHQHKRKRSINHLYSKTSLFVFLNRIDSIFFLHLPFLFLLGFFLFLLGVSDLDFVNRSDPAPFPFFSFFLLFQISLGRTRSLLDRRGRRRKRDENFFYSFARKRHGLGKHHGPHGPPRSTYNNNNPTNQTTMVRTPRARALAAYEAHSNLHPP